MRQRRRLSSKPHTDHTSPIMPNHNSFLLVALPALVHPILNSQRHNELRHFFIDIRRRVRVQTIGASIARQINGNESRRLLQRGRAHELSPYRPAVGEAMHEDDQRFGGFQGGGRGGGVVADEMELEAAAEGYDVVRQAGPVFGEVPESITS